MAIFVASLGLSCGATAAPSTLTATNVIHGSSNTPTTLAFPIARGGELNDDVYVNYRTADLTGVAGIDYTATSGTLRIPVGATSATVPIVIAPNTGATASAIFRVILEAATGVGPPASFATQPAFGMGAFPTAAIGVDINGDGLADLVSTNLLDNTVSVRLNATAVGAMAASYGAMQTFATGAFPYALASADFNNDGVADLVVTNYGDSSVSVLLGATPRGAATASFATAQTFATGAGPAAVVVLDVNSDGKPDLALAERDAGTYSVLLNTTAPGAATPTFSARTQFGVPGGVQSLSVARTGIDRHEGLLIVNKTLDVLTVVGNQTPPGATTPDFFDYRTVPTGATPQAAIAVDLNGDGRVDLVAVNSADSTVSVALDVTAFGQPVAQFPLTQSFATGVHPVAVVSGDVNGDGKPDLIVANLYDDTLSVLINATAAGATSANFVQAQSLLTGGGPSSLALAQVERDGKPDLIVANYSDDSVSVLLNGTTPATLAGLAAPLSFAAGGGPFDVDAGDLNGDGKPDLVLANRDEGQISILLNTTVAGAATSYAAPQNIAIPNGPRGVAIGDINGDGLPDVVVTQSSFNLVSVLLNSTPVPGIAPTFLAPTTTSAGQTPFPIAMADFNGDGKLDFVAASGGNSAVSIAMNQTAMGANTAVFASATSFVCCVQPQTVITPDLNGDSRPDIVMGNSGNAFVSVLINNTVRGAAGPSFSGELTFATEANPKSVAAADLNGDGKLDLISANAFTNSVSVLLNTTAAGASTPTFAARQNTVVGSSPQAVTSADLDGDGKPDVIVTRTDGNAIWLRNTTPAGSSTASFAAPAILSAAGDGIDVRALDVDGDGKPDVVAANQGAHTVSVLRNTHYATTITGSPAAVTIVHDYLFANGFE